MASPTAPPSHLNSDSFYTKYLDVAGIPILAPESVPDRELEQARDIVLSMTIDRPDLLNRLAENEFRILLYNERMEGGINQLPEFRDFQYHDPTGGLFDETERVIGVAMMMNHDCNPVLIHEFGHALEWALEELQPESDFRYNLIKTYRNAKTAGLWEGRYANTASTEYWAEMLRYRLQTKVFRREFGLDDMSDYDDKGAAFIQQHLGQPELPSFCQHEEFTVQGRVVDHNNDPIEGMWVTLSIWGRVDEHPIGSWGNWFFDWHSVQTGNDGRFLLEEAMDPGLFENADFFTLGLYRDQIDEYPLCNVAAFPHKEGQYVTKEWQHTVAVKRQHVRGLNVYTLKIPVGFDWSPIWCR